MSLTNVDSSNGYLEATATDGIAVSEVITQNVEDGDFTEVKNISADFEFVNISTATVADTLITDELIVDGDKLVIVKNDDTIHEAIATGVSDVPASPSGIISLTMTSNSQDGHTVSSSGANSATYEAWKAFDGDTQSYWFSLTAIQTGWVAYEFPTPEALYSYRIMPRNAGGNNSNGSLTSWAFEGWNGSTWDILHLQDTVLAPGNGQWFEYVLVGIEVYAKYRVRSITTNGTYTSIAEIELIGLAPLLYSMDTTATTAGEIPSRVFRTNEAIFFNDTEAAFLNDTMIISDITLVPDLTEGLVSHYLLNNNADDVAGTFDGTPSGGVDFQGDVASFDGTDDYIDSGYKTSNSSNTYTISAWVSRNSINTIDCLYGEIDLTSNSYGAYISFSSDGVSLAASHFKAIQSNSDEIKVDISSYINSMSDMNHVVFTRENNVNHKLYVNGTLVGTASCANVVTTSSFNGSIGDAVNSDPRPFDGKISNFRIYSNTKDQTFIDALYAEGYCPKPLTEPTTTGLIAHYPLTGTAEDSTGNYDGVENGNIYVNDAEFGSVADFDGTNDYIQTAYVVPAITQYSISTSFKTSTSGSIQMFFCDADSAGSQIVSRLLVGIWSTDKFFVNMGDGTSVWYDITSADASSYQDGEWHSLVLTIDGFTQKLYIDNSLIHTYTSTVSAGTLGTEPLVFGRFGAYNGHYLNGLMRGNRIYESLLTTQEITDIYNYEKNFRSIYIDDGLIAYYPLANNSLDNYYNEYDGVDTAMTYNGDSAVFNGSTSYISIDKTTFNGIQNRSTYSISVWANIATGYADYDTIYNEMVSGTSQARLNISVVGTDIVCGGRNTDGSAWTEWCIGAFTAETLLHILVTIDTANNAIKLYINKILMDTYSVSISTFPNTASSYDHNIGALTGASSSFNIDANISKVRIYNKALTPEQIEVIYNEELPLVEEPVQEILLSSTRTFDDVDVTGRTLETKVELSATGNKMIELSSDIWKLP